jgi:DNA-directed RNA polymerase specialized sigma24 family protein
MSERTTGTAGPLAGGGRMDSATEVFVTHRNLLFTVAYEMLGSAADAEDVLQETWLRWVGVDLDTVQRAYLVRIARRTDLRSCRRRDRPGRAPPPLSKPRPLSSADHGTSVRHPTLGPDPEAASPRQPVKDSGPKRPHATKAARAR